MHGFPFPREISLGIVYHLSYADVIQLSLTCRSLYSVSNDNTLWKHLFNKHYPISFKGEWWNTLHASFDNLIELNNDWKSKFIERYIVAQNWKKKRFRSIAFEAHRGT